MVSNESGTYARAPYAFAALGQGPKGPELVVDKKKPCEQFSTKNHLDLKSENSEICL